MQHAPYMIHPTTKAIFPYNEQLVRESNFRPYDGPLPVINKLLGVRILEDDVEFESDNEIKREEESKQKRIFDSHVEKIVEAMKELPKKDFLTANGMPKLTVLEKICKFKPTLEEREAAFSEFNKIKEINDACAPMTVEARQEHIPEIIQNG